MEINLRAIVDIINGVGFPIAASIALFWLNRETIKEQQKLLIEFKDIIRDNSEVMRDLVDELKGGK